MRRARRHTRPANLSHTEQWAFGIRRRVSLSGITYLIGDQRRIRTPVYNTPDPRAMWGEKLLSGGLWNQAEIRYQPAQRLPCEPTARRVETQGMRRRALSSRTRLAR